MSPFIEIWKGAVESVYHGASGPLFIARPAGRNLDRTVRDLSRFDREPRLLLSPQTEK